ncbi:MAG: hypothetical protein ABIL58_23525 [Pseudomonadota bacterium]
MTKKLYEFTANLTCAYVVAAETEGAARQAIETFERAWFESGDFIGVSDVELAGVRIADQDCLEDLAHEIV